MDNKFKNISTMLYFNPRFPMKNNDLKKKTNFRNEIPKIEYKNLNIGPQNIRD